MVYVYTHTRPRAYTCGRILAARSSRQTMIGGGLSLQTLSSEERLRHAPFLTVLGTHSVSRSFPLSPQRMLASLATVSVAAGPVSHAHPVTSKLQRNQTPHAYAACYVSVTLHCMRVAGNTLEASCCRTRRRLCVKYRLRSVCSMLSRESSSCKRTSQAPIVQQPPGRRSP